MGRILFITKCYEREHFLESTFRQLGHEVFLSSQFLGQLFKQPKTASLTDFFKIIVMSETLTNQEVLFILNAFQDQNLSIFRKVETVPPEEERQAWIGKGISDWIGADISIEELREKLTGFNDSSKDKLCYKGEAIEKRSLSSLALNSIQFRFLHILSEAPDRVITRDEMCELLWNRSSTHSNLSQLSCLVKVLRKKLADQGIEGESIITVWGQGYKLSDSFFKQMSTDISVLS